MTKKDHITHIIYIFYCCSLQPQNVSVEMYPLELLKFKLILQKNYLVFTTHTGYSMPTSVNYVPL